MKKDMFRVKFMIMMMIITVLSGSVPCGAQIAHDETGFAGTRASVVDWQHDFMDPPKPIDQERLHQEAEFLEYLEEKQGSQEEEISAETAEVLPVKYDGRSYHRVTSVKNQGNLGLCWDYSTLATVESALIASGAANTSVDLSELHAAYFTWKKSDLGLNFLDFCNHGYNPYTLLTLMLEKQGPVLETKAPMVSVDAKTSLPADMERMHDYRVRKIHPVKINRENMDRVKTMIKQYGGLVADYYSYALAYQRNPDGSGVGSYYFSENRYSVTHAIEIVGWDDNYSAANFAIRPAGNGAWLVKNSWGAGEVSSVQTKTGYYWISYYEGSLGSYSAYAVEAGENGIPVSKIQLAQNHLTVTKNQVIDLGIKVLPENATNKSVQIKIADPGVVYRNINGELIAGGFGTTTLTVTPDDEECEPVTCEVTVARQAIQLNREEFVYDKTSALGAASLSLVVTGDDGGEINASACKYESSNSAVASVTNKGVIKTGEAGTAEITVSYTSQLATENKTLKAVCRVYVNQKAYGIKLNQGSIKGDVGQKYQLSATITPEGANQDVSFTSNNPSVAKVDANGQVTIVGYGTATISASTTDGTRRSANCSVLSVRMVKEIVLENSQITMKEQTSKRLSAKALPENAANAMLDFVSSDSNVVTVSEFGQLTAKKAGTATITVKSIDGSNLTKEVSVVVEKNQVYGMSPVDGDEIRTYTYDQIGSGYVQIFQVDADEAYPLSQIKVASSDTGVLQITKSNSRVYGGKMYLDCSYKLIGSGQAQLILSLDENPYLNAIKKIEVQKKPEEKPVEEKKPEEKSTEEKKDDEKPDQGKTEEQKSEEQKSEEQKPEEQSKAELQKPETKPEVQKTEVQKIEVQRPVVQKPVMQTNQKQPVSQSAVNKEILSKEEQYWQELISSAETVDPSGQYVVSYDDKKNGFFLLYTTKKLRGVVKVPESIVVGEHRAPVIGLAVAAFQDENQVKKIILPDTIREIHENAFEGCIGLTSVRLGNGLERIDAESFIDCTSLKSITIPKKVKTIGKRAFYGCSSLKKVKVSSTKLTKVGKKAFYKTAPKTTIFLNKNKRKKYQKLMQKAVPSTLQFKVL